MFHRAPAPVAALEAGGDPSRDGRDPPSRATTSRHSAPEPNSCTTRSAPRAGARRAQLRASSRSRVSTAATVSSHIVVLELADRLAVESDRQPQADRLRVDEDAAGDERAWMRVRASTTPSGSTHQSDQPQSATSKLSRSTSSASAAVHARSGRALVCRRPRLSPRVRHSDRTRTTLRRPAPPRSPVRRPSPQPTSRIRAPSSGTSASIRFGSAPATSGTCTPSAERLGQRPRVDDDERLRRPRQRDVELAQAAVAVVRDRRPARRRRRGRTRGPSPAAASAPGPRSRRTARPAAARRRASAATITASSPSCSASAAASRSAAASSSSSPTCDEPRRVAALAVRERRLDLRRDPVEQRQREVHDLGRDAVGVPQLLDLDLRLVGQVRLRAPASAGRRRGRSPARRRRGSSASRRPRGARSRAAASARDPAPRRRSRARTRAAGRRSASAPRRAAAGRGRSSAGRTCGFGRSRSRSFCSSASSIPSDAAASAAGEVSSRATSFSGCGSGRTRSSQLREEAAAPQRALDLVEAAERARAEQLAVALVEAAEHGHAEPLARERERRAGLERLLEQLATSPLAHRDEDAVDEQDELLRRRLHRELDRARARPREPRVAPSAARRRAPPRARPRSRRAARTPRAARPPPRRAPAARARRSP